MMKKNLKMIMAAALVAITGAAQAQWTTTGTVVHPTTLTNNLSVGTTVNGANIYVQKTTAVTMGIKSTGAGATIFMDKGLTTANAAFAYRYLGTTQWNSGMLGNNNFSIRNVPLNSFPIIINAATDNIALNSLGGSVSIGTETPATGYLLSVKGKVICEEIKVQLKSDWPDYVFSKDYKVMSIEEIAKFIKANNHLPGMPSAAEVAKNGGVEIGEMQRLLLEKMEELMLQNIQQQKEIEELKKLLSTK